IFHDEDGFIPAARGFLLVCLPRRTGLGTGGKKDCERGALFDLAFDFEPPLVLLDDAIDGRQPQASALADSFGRKKRSENTGSCGSVHPTAGIGNAQTDKIAFSRLRVALDVTLVNFSGEGANSQLAA